MEKSIKPVRKEQTNNATEIQVKQELGIVMPAVSAQGAADAWKSYQELKAKIVDKEKDIQVIGKEEFLKKSYWRKLATFFNISTEIIEEKSEPVSYTPLTLPTIYSV